jgi:hypothetical protein
MFILVDGPKVSCGVSRSVVLGFKAEMIINVHVIGIDESDYYKDVVPITLSLPAKPSESLRPRQAFVHAS